MTVYVGRNRNGVWKASLDYEKVKYFDHLREVDLPVVHEKVYLIQVYNGFDYDCYSETNPIRDDVRYSQEVYHSVSSLKKSDLWKAKEKLVKENPEKYHVTPFSIASDQYGKPFICGDVMEGMFNMKIIVVKVYRRINDFKLEEKWKGEDNVRECQRFI